MPLTAYEQEGIVLNAVWSMIDGMANYGLMDLLGDGVEKQVMFHTSRDARLFNILLVDFLSKPESMAPNPMPFDLPRPPGNASSSNRTYLFYLRGICDNPQLGGNPVELRQAVEEFGAWLEANSTIANVWFADISLQTNVTISRFDYLKLCGDIAKHNFSRLSRNVEKLRRILHDNGHDIDSNQGYLALPNFFERFHDDLFLYHASEIARHLNHIRWSIHHYLGPAYAAAYRVSPNVAGYTFEVPAALVDPLAKGMWWDVMNRVRGQPWQPEFTVAAGLQQR